MSPENQPQDQHIVPATEQERQAEGYEINLGDVLYVKRNLKDPETGEYLLDENGKVQKKLEDGWEVIDTQYENPVTGRVEILLQNTANPDEAKPVPEWRLREVQEEAEESLASQAAARMIALEVKPDVKPSMEADPILEQFRNEISQDMGETATEEVVEVGEEILDEEISEDSHEASEEDAEQEAHELISAALRQFEIREGYATNELQLAVSTALNTLYEQSGAFGSTVSVLRTTETIRLGIDNALRNYDESMRQLEGRGIVDYDPRVVLYRQLDQSIGQLYSIRSMVMNTTEQNVVTMKRSTENLERTMKEVEHTADSDEDDISGYLEELSKHKGIETPTAPQTEGIRAFLRGIDKPLANLNKALFDIDEEYGEVSETIRKLINSVQRLHGEVQRGARPSSDQLSEIQEGFRNLVDEQMLDQLSRKGQQVESAVEAIPRRVPTSPLRQE